MLRSEHAPELVAVSDRPGGPITLTQGVEMIVVDADVLQTILDEHNPEPEPCDSEVWSWSIYRPEQMDPYWIHCTLVGQHDRHKDSNTGATWSE